MEPRDGGALLALLLGLETGIHRTSPSYLGFHSPPFLCTSNPPQPGTASPLQKESPRISVGCSPPPPLPKWARNLPSTPFMQLGPGELSGAHGAWCQARRTEPPKAQRCRSFTQGDPVG